MAIRGGIRQSREWHSGRRWRRPGWPGSSRVSLGNGVSGATLPDCCRHTARRHRPCSVHPGSRFGAAASPLRSGTAFDRSRAPLRLRSRDERNSRGNRPDPERHLGSIPRGWPLCRQLMPHGVGRRTSLPRRHALSPQPEARDPADARRPDGAHRRGARGARRAPPTKDGAAVQKTP